MHVYIFNEGTGGAEANLALQKSLFMQKNLEIYPIYRDKVTK